MSPFVFWNHFCQNQVECIFGHCEDKNNWMYRYSSTFKTNSLENSLPWTHSYCELLKHQYWLSPLCTWITEGAFPTTWIQGQCTKIKYWNSFSKHLLQRIKLCVPSGFTGYQRLLPRWTKKVWGRAKGFFYSINMNPIGMKQNTTTNYQIRFWFSLDMEHRIVKVWHL